jgi:hypothetical protein
MEKLNWIVGSSRSWVDADAIKRKVFQFNPCGWPIGSGKTDVVEREERKVDISH